MTAAWLAFYLVLLTAAWPAFDLVRLTEAWVAVYLGRLAAAWGGGGCPPPGLRGWWGCSLEAIRG